MNELLLIIILFIGIGLLVFGGRYVVNFCSKLSDLTGINEALIGGSVLALAATTPELIITILGSFQKANKLVVGNIFGTILVNVCLILGFNLSIIKLLRINRKTIDKISILIFLVLTVSICWVFNVFNFIIGIILIMIFVIYFTLTFLDIKKDLILKNKLNRKNVLNKNVLTTKDKISDFLKFIIGVLLIFAGAQLIINSTENLSKLFNVNSTIIGLIVVAVGTSLPELITSIISLKKKRMNLAIGTIIGANIVNLSLLLGLSCCLNFNKGLVFNIKEIILILPMLALSLSVLAFPILINKRTYKWQGITLLSLYAIYCIIIILIM
ncbi:MAG: sodium:calcium antiporter [Clostridiales bacterium]|nr:sodium:calcium antiporter [Clostridiales bacterium]